MRITRYIQVFILTVLPLLASAQEGRVIRFFDDVNQNGICDKGEKGVRNVGLFFSGNMHMSSSLGKIGVAGGESEDLFLVLPDGYILNQKGFQNFRPENGKNEYSVPLRRVDKKKEYRVAVLGDLQVKDTEQLKFASSTVLSELASRSDIDFMINMGDLVNDRPELTEEASRISDIGIPAWCVIGNHDMGRPKQRTDEVFRSVIGNSVGAFYRGKTCFILINDIQDFREPLSSVQIDFMRSLVMGAASHTQFVLMMHVPLQGVANHEEILGIFQDRKLLVLSAHMHAIFRRHWADNIDELSVGATCGSWWVGERDAWGIPVALMQCGSPRSYFVFDFSDRGYNFQVKPVGWDSSRQYSLYVKGELSSDPDIEALSSLDDGTVLVNVFAGGDQTQVRYRVNDSSEWKILPKVDVADPAVLRVAYLNRQKEGGYPTKYSRRQPLRKETKSPHIYGGVIPEIINGVHTLHFEVSDPYGMKPFLFSRVVYLRQK